MSSAGKAFAEKWRELCDGADPYLPLDELLDHIRTSEAAAVKNGLKHNPLILHQLLLFFGFEEEDPLEQIEIIRLLLDICPEAAAASISADNLWSGDEDPNNQVYPLHVACYNYVTPNEVIELLLEASTAGLDHMVAMDDGVIECGDIKVAGTPLDYYLARMGDIAFVERLLEACPEALTVKDMTTHGLTPLHIILRAPSKPDLEMVKFLVQYNASILQEQDACGHYPIHTALYNQFITVEVIEVLLESSSTNVWEMRAGYGDSPMHALLKNVRIKETLAIGILHLILRMAPNESFFQAADERGRMPIHHAASAGHGAEVCKLLVELAPGCERIPDRNGQLPIHGARDIDTVKYLVSLYPESIYAESRGNITPFQYAVRELEGLHRADIVWYFLELDPTFASTAVVAFRGGRREDLLPLQAACIKWDYCKRIGVCCRFEVVKILFDHYPSAFLVSDSNGMLPVDLAKEALVKEKEERRPWYSPHNEVISFLENQHPFIVDASNSDALNTPDENGRLLLHHALLEKNISLGTIKMIVSGTNHAAAVRGPNPLHLACANCAPDIVQYLSGVYPSLMNGVDDEGCNILHLACKGGNLKVVQYLLEQHAPMIAQTNRMNLLPVHLLCYKSDKGDIFGCPDWRKEREYVGIVWQLLLACPAAVSSAVATLD